MELLSFEFDVEFRNFCLVVDPENNHALEVEIEKVDNGSVGDHGVLILLA